jgi:hypothetical protein
MVTLAKQSPEFMAFWLLLAFAGYYVGWLCCYFLPWSWYLRDESVLTAEELAAQYPQKAWVTEAPWLGPVTCAVLTMLFILEQGIYLSQPSLVLPFFAPLAFMLGYNAFAGLIEIRAEVSMRLPFGRGRHGPMPYIVSPRVWLVGAYRIVLTVVVFTAFFILVRWEKAGWG